MKEKNQWRFYSADWDVLMIGLVKNEDCCGCGGCAQICPKHCISMQYNFEGFLYPVVDSSSCVNCKMCLTVCPVLNEHHATYGAIDKTPYAYAVKNKDENIRYNSSSGGLFTLIAEYVIDHEGIVFGCKLDESLHAVHIGVESKDDLRLLRGSKYVQSEIGNVYNEIKTLVWKKKTVLFVGTPCQAAGLYAFLGNRKFDNLIIADFICHGVPSPKLFEDYISSEEKKANKKIISHSFRNKDKGWKQSGLQLGSESRYADGTSKRRYPAFNDSYMNAFLGDICLRESCYVCRHKYMPKEYADLTLGDFWGIDSIDPSFNDGRGISMLLVNTKHGELVWNAINTDCDWISVNYEKAIKRNKPLIKSADKSPKRNRFFREYEEKGYNYVERKYMSAMTWVYHKIFSIIRNSFERFEQIGKFCIVGVSNTLISLAVYYILLFFGMDYRFAYFAGFVLSVCNAFFWNSRMVFKKKTESNMVVAFIKVVTSYGVSFLLSIAMMGILVETFNVSVILAPVIKMIITIPLNFILNKLWAFKDIT